MGGEEVATSVVDFLIVVLAMVAVEVRAERLGKKMEQRQRRRRKVNCR